MKKRLKKKINHSDKRVASSSSTPIWAILIVVLCTFFTASGQYFIKKGVVNVHAILDMINFNLIFGLALYLMGAVILIVALRYGSLSVLYPLISLGFIWVALLGIFLLGEVLTLWNWLGILSIIIGITFIGFSERKVHVKRVRKVSKK